MGTTGRRLFVRQLLCVHREKNDVLGWPVCRGKIINSSTRIEGVEIVSRHPGDA